MTHTSALSLCLLVALGACFLTLPARGAAAALALNADDDPTLDDAVGALPAANGWYRLAGSDIYCGILEAPLASVSGGHAQGVEDSRQ